MSVYFVFDFFFFPTLLQIELALNNNISNLESPEIIGYHMYMDIMIRLRYEAEIEDKKLKSRHRAAESCEFDSSLKYQESLTKHSRMKAGMNTKQTQPLTSSQGIVDLHSIAFYFCHLVSFILSHFFLFFSFFLLLVMRLMW